MIVLEIIIMALIGGTTAFLYVQIDNVFRYVKTIREMQNVLVTRQSDQTAKMELLLSFMDRQINQQADLERSLTRTFQEVKGNERALFELNEICNKHYNEYMERCLLEDQLPPPEDDFEQFLTSDGLVSVKALKENRARKGLS